MTNHATRATKLTHLPLELLSRIISFLSRTHSRKPIQLSLDALEKEFKRHEHEMERDLLAVAKASPLLALATANVLANRAICLSSSTALELLPKWIEALAPFVRAVTTNRFRTTIPSSWNVRRGVHFDHRFLEDQPPPPPRHRNNRSSHFPYYRTEILPPALKDWLSGTVLHLCKSLSLDSVSLVVLDLKHIHFHKMNIPCDDISRALGTALQSNCHSLKELSLQASEPCAQALMRVTLKKLSKMELAFYFEHDSIESSTRFLAFMLRAMDGLADRERGISTVSELRISCDWLLGSSDESLLLTADDSVGASLRDSVKILQVDGFDWSELHLDHAIKFVCLFDTLECLTWHHVIFPRHVREIKTQCQSFQDLRIYPYHSPQVGDAIEFEEVFTMCNGTLKTLIAHEVLSVVQIRTLRRTNNDLRRIALRVERDSVAEVVALLRSCKRLQSFHLLTADFKDDERMFEGFGADSLEEITRAVCSIESRDLEEVIIELDGRLWLEQYRIQPAMKSMQDVVNFLGERAKVVRYTARTRRAGAFKGIIEGLCAILRTCRLKAWNMRELNADFNVHGRVDIGDVEGTEMWQQLKKERERLVECVPTLHSLSLGRELEMMQI